MWIYALTIVFGMVSAFFMSRFSVSLGSLIDVVIDPADSLKTAILLCVCMLVCWLLFSFICDYTEIIYVNKIVRHLKTDLYEALRQKELRSFLAEKKGDYLSLFSKDIDLVVDNYLMPRCDMICSLLSAVVCMLSIFVLNWKLGFAFVLISVMTIIISQIPGAVMAKKTVDYTESNSRYLATLENYLNGFEQIKLLGLGKLFGGKLDRSDFTYEKSRKGYLFANAAAVDVGMSVGMLSQLLCMAVGIWFVTRGSMTVGVLIAAVQLLNGVFSPLQNFIQNKNLMGTADEIIERIEKNQAVGEEAEKEIEEKVKQIEFRDVSIRFGDKQILDHFNFQFEQDKKYAVVGESGKGKSTLVKLIMKYFTAQEYDGSILLNGQDVTTLGAGSVYDRIGYVQKNEFLIDGTVRDNILLYREDIPDKEVEDVCQSLKLDAALVQKSIDQSNTGEISFGEKQRIDIARFMVHDYDVLVFDEPTSNLDAGTAKEIFDMIFHIKDKIVIVITHDHSPQLLDRFDRVIRLWD